MQSYLITTVIRTKTVRKMIIVVQPNNVQPHKNSNINNLIVGTILAITIVIISTLNKLTQFIAVL